MEEEEGEMDVGGACYVVLRFYMCLVVFYGGGGGEKSGVHLVCYLSIFAVHYQVNACTQSRVSI